MAQPQYDNNGNVVKKKFKIKFAGFTFGIGHIVALILVIGIVFGLSSYSSYKQRKADEEEVARRNAELEAIMANQGNQQEFDMHAQIQASLTEQFGVAPEGFEWGYTGELIAIGNDDDHTCEDVVYMFVRSLSILDFSTAQRYSSDSRIIKQYQEYYGIASDVITDYYRDFLRKQLKTSLTSLEITGISDVAVFADGTEYLTLNVKVLDLTDKDFWEADRADLFETMRVYKETEDDVTKVEQYVYEYIYEKYLDGTIGKRDCTVELVVSKESGSGWLISSDRELNAYLQYENGVDVAKYILNEFNSWYLDKILQEQIEQVGGVGFGMDGNIDDTYGDTGDGTGAVNPPSDTDGDSGEDEFIYDTIEG